MEDRLVHIQYKIYEVRGQTIMLDFDLAEMYQVETKNLKCACQAERRLKAETKNMIVKL